MGRHFLVAVDKSEGAAQAFQFLLGFALPADEVTLLHVWDESEANDTVAQLSPRGAPPVNVAYEMDVESEALLSGFRKAAEERGLTCRTATRTGTPKAEIVAAAEREEPDVLVVGSRALGTVTRALAGSVSDHCVHHSPCPVLVVRDRSAPRGAAAAADAEEAPSLLSRAVHVLC